jgi:hypothetical protein
VEANLCRFFLLVVYICITVGDQIIKKGRVEIPYTSSTLPHFYACPKSGPGFKMPHVFFEYNELRWEMVIPFVDIDGTVDHH